MQDGRTCTANYNTGTYASPTWVAIGRLSSPSRPQGRPTSRKTYREASNSKNALGVRDYGFSGTYVQKADAAAATDSVFAALLASYTNGTAMDLALLDGPAATNGSTGVRGAFAVSKLDKSEDDEDAVVYDVEWVEVEDAEIAETVAYTIAS